MEDPIIKEIHQFREELAARFDYDLEKIFEFFRAKEVRPVISCSPKSSTKDNERENQAA